MDHSVAHILSYYILLYGIRIIGKEQPRKYMKGSSFPNVGIIKGTIDKIPTLIRGFHLMETLCSLHFYAICLLNGNQITFFGNPSLNMVTLLMLGDYHIL